MNQKKKITETSYKQMAYCAKMAFLTGGNIAGRKEQKKKKRKERETT